MALKLKCLIWIKSNNKGMFYVLQGLSFWQSGTSSDVLLSAHHPTWLSSRRAAPSKHRPTSYDSIVISLFAVHVIKSPQPQGLANCTIPCTVCKELLEAIVSSINMHWIGWCSESHKQAMPGWACCHKIHNDLRAPGIAGTQESQHQQLCSR